MKIPSQSLDLHSLLFIFGQAPDHNTAGNEADRAGQNVGNEPSPEEPEDGFEPEGQKSQRDGQYDYAKNIEQRPA